MDQRFTDRTVAITGAAGNIGEGIARRLVAEGANVVLVGRHADTLEALAATFPTGRAVAAVADVSQEEDTLAMAATAVRRFGGIDVLVSNAGVGFFKPFGEITSAEWRASIDVNLTSAYLCAQACLPHLRASRGNIVHTGSASGHGGDAGMTPYNAAKGALDNLTRGLAFDLGPDGIRVNTVSPSLTFPQGVDHPMLTPAFLARFDDRRALPGHSTPDDIGAAVAFLASEDARFITGAILPVDGGITAGSGQPRFGIDA